MSPFRIEHVNILEVLTKVKAPTLSITFLSPLQLGEAILVIT